MALFHECMQSCAHIVLDTADIVRDGDITTVAGLSRQIRSCHSNPPGRSSAANSRWITRRG